MGGCQVTCSPLRGSYASTMGVILVMDEIGEGRGRQVPTP